MDELAVHVAPLDALAPAAATATGTATRMTESHNSPGAIAIDDDPDGDAFARTLLGGHEAPPAAIAADAWALARWGEVPGLRRYLAGDGGRVGAAAVLHVHGGVAYLANASTLPDARRRGLHAALVARRLTDARAAGADAGGDARRPGRRERAQLRPRRAARGRAGAPPAGSRDRAEARWGVGILPAMEQRYDPQAIETRWQRVWDEERAFETPNPDDPAHDARPHSYVLEMLPYPSGELHIGHVSNYTMGDVISHFRRRHGQLVLHPMGYDAFGLPAENAAIKTGGHPADVTRDNIDKIRVQAKRMGWSLDWSRELADVRPRVLPLDAVDLPAPVRARAGVQEGRHRQLVPGRPDGARQRAGHRRPLRALWRRGRGARRCRSGTSASPTTPTGCSTTWRRWRAGRSAC